MATWFRAASIRAVKTKAQTAIALIGVSVAMEQVDWKLVLSASVLAGVVSILTSLKGLPEVDADTKEIERNDDNRKGE